MDEATAMARLESMVAADSDPKLSAPDLAELVAMARRPDTDGLLPSDAGWTGTYDLNAAAAEGWRWKAAKAAGDFTFSSDGQSFNRSDVVRACQEMARTYQNRVTGGVPLNVAREWDSDIAGNVGV